MRGDRPVFKRSGCAVGTGLLVAASAQLAAEPRQHPSEHRAGARAAVSGKGPHVDPPGREWSGRAGALPYGRWPRATGDWGGVRTQLEELGLTLGGDNVFEMTSVWDGGVHQRASNRNLLTVDAELDLEKTVGLAGGTAYIQFLSVTAEKGGSADAGDIQVNSNIENDRSLGVVYELWVEQLLLDDRLRIKAGKVDANSQFNYVDAAGDFVNSSAGYSPTIGSGFYDGAAAVDGVRTGSRGPSTFFHGGKSDDHFHVVEGAAKCESIGPLHDGRFSVGGLWHTGEFRRFDGATDDTTAGFYLTAEQRILVPAGDDSDCGLYVFVQYGWTDEQVREFQHHVAAGIVERGMILDRDGDAAGVYLSFVDLSDEARAGFERHEYVIDAYYRCQIIGSVFVQPEIQYIINPSGAASVDDAVVGGRRAGGTF